MSNIKNAMIQAKINLMTNEEIITELRKIRLQEATAEAVNEARIRIARYHTNNEAEVMIEPLDIIIH